MIPLELALFRDPRVIVEAMYAGVKGEVDDEDMLSYLGDGLADDFRVYYYAHTRLLRSPRYLLYLHAEKVETLVQEVLKRSKEGNPVRVLDMGCGMGSESIALGLMGAEVHGVDIDGRCVQIAQRRSCWYESRLGRKLKVTFTCNDAGKMGALPFALCDIVFAHGSIVFFHLVDDFLKAATTSLRPGGSLIITDVNIAHPFNRIGFFLHTGRVRFSFDTHRPLTPRQMRRRFEANGLEVKLARGYGYVPPFVVERSESIRRLIAGLEGLIPTELSYVTGLTYLMVGEKPGKCG
jgi:SAM-dependent methyltransferase